MKFNALIHYGAKNIVMEEREMGECGDKDIIVKLLRSSICGSDADIYLNGGALHFVPEGAEFGHELVGEVYQVGKDVKDLKVGDRIAPYPLLFTPMMHRAGWLGGYSQYIYGTNAEVNKTLFKIDDKMSNTLAALIEPTSIGVTAADSAEDVNENTIVIMLGGGFIGFATAARRVQRGVPKKNITFVERATARVKLLREQGFNVADTGEEDWQQKLFAYTGTTFGTKGVISAADYIFDTAGSINPNGTAPTLLDMAFPWAKNGCKIMQVGVHRRKVNVPVQDMVFCGWSLISTSGCGKGGFPSFVAAIDLLMSDVVDFEAAVTNVFKFEDALEAIKYTTNPNQCMKVQVDFT